MFFLDSLLVGGLRFVMDKLAEAADAELHDDTSLRERLLEAQMQLELGELTEEDFAAVERDVLARLREVRGDTTDGLVVGAETKVVGIEATVAEELDE